MPYVSIHLGFPSFYCTHVAHGTESSSFSNDCNPRFALHEYEQSNWSATNRMDLCQLGSVTSEWHYSDHTNSITFLKRVFQINIYKVKWGSSPLHTMSNSDSYVELFLPSVPVLPAQLMRVHLIHRGCRTIDSGRVVLTRCPCSIRRGCPTFDSHHVVLSLVRWQFQDDWKSSRDYFPDTQSWSVLINLIIISSTR